MPVSLFLFPQTTLPRQIPPQGCQVAGTCHNWILCSRELLPIQNQNCKLLFPKISGMIIWICLQPLIIDRYYPPSYECPAVVVVHCIAVDPIPVKWTCRQKKGCSLYIWSGLTCSLRWSHFISVFIINMPACACYHTSVKIARVVYFFCKIHEKTGSLVIRLPAW